MSLKRVIHNGTIVNRGERFEGYVTIGADGRIEAVERGVLPDGFDAGYARYDARGGLILPGAIDDQVHFREPGLTYKADIQTESRAAAAGGVTSYMEMPNTIPQTTTNELLAQKYERAAEVSAVNYAFYLGATNDNLSEIRTIDPKHTAGVKLFMGSSTGNMLVDRRGALEAIFAESPVLVATHCEDEAIVQANIKKWGEGARITDHALIRSEEACYRSSSLAAELATKYDARLHILHLSTAREMSILEAKPLKDKKITGEVCVHHLWFSDADYAMLGNRIKWNPSIKTAADREVLREALAQGRLDVVATDHAPHTIEEKDRTYVQAPGGGPLVQHSLVAMLEIFPVDKVVDWMAHRVAECFRVKDRGYIEPGMWADVAIVERQSWNVGPENILYKCGWSPFEGVRFHHKVTGTFVNGDLVYDRGQFDDSVRGKALEFDR